MIWQHYRQQKRRQKCYNCQKVEHLCYNPWDGSHSFIGNQAAGQARGHHGSQVTNQQEVTWLLRHTRESQHSMHEASRQSHQSWHRMHEASRQSHQSWRRMHEVSRQSYQSWRRVHNMVGLSRQSHLSWRQDCQDNLDCLDRPALYSPVIVPLWNDCLQLMLWSRQLDLLQYNLFVQSYWSGVTTTMFHQTSSHSLTLLSCKNQPAFHILLLILYLVRTAQYRPQHFEDPQGWVPQE